MELEKMNAMQPMRASVNTTRPAISHGDGCCSFLIKLLTALTQSLDTLLDVGQLVLALGVLGADILHQSRRGTLHELGVVQLMRGIPLRICKVMYLCPAGEKEKERYLFGMLVVKGESAAALYGSRAGNGVILITTKKGTKPDGIRYPPPA